jgi:hypothetical protein
VTPSRTASVAWRGSRSRQRPEAGTMTAPAQGTAPRPLDEVMMAMDVVDTLRHRQHLVAAELEGEAREAALIERLRQIYTAQGIEVTDRVLAEGVAALREERFAYRPPPDSWALRLARVYVQRGLWVRRVAVVAIVLLVAWGAYQAAVVAPRDALAAQLQGHHASIERLTSDAAVRSRAAALAERGAAAMRAGDLPAARDARAALATLEETLEQAYVLQIVVGANEASGVWRVPELNPSARNHYLIVEAVDERGRRVTLPVTNEETGAVERVSTFGLRVDEATFERVAADKRDDGIIQDRIVGVKRRGELEPEYAVATTGEAITRW